ncbi:MAG: pantoate--beta-alanine ligase [Crocinitomicaceae bacterium]|nr:pantoate--beta-alanine ligase [Crocinitomicaceae bacterium]
MFLAKTKEDLQQVLNSNKDKRIGLVPTMGALHEGHLSLIQKAKAETDFVVVSIFVNPKQFNDPKDLENYPSDLEGDLKKIQEFADCAFCPDINNVYPDDFKEKYFELDHLEEVMEGKHRKGHFQGVCNIVYILLDLVQPDKAYFGIKDYQQLAIIKHMSKVNFPQIEIVPCDIIREENGLAKSSRNLNLSRDEFEKASIIYKNLLEAREMIRSNKSIDQVKEIVQNNFQQENIQLEYFEITDSETLLPVDQKKSKSRGFIAAYVGNVRLIDNLELIE